MSISNSTLISYWREFSDTKYWIYGKDDFAILKCVLCIKIQDVVESFLFCNVCQNIPNGGGFIDAEDDYRAVGHNEHQDGGDKNLRKIDIHLLLIQPSLEVSFHEKK